MRKLYLINTFRAAGLRAVSRLIAWWAAPHLFVYRGGVGHSSATQKPWAYFNFSVLQFAPNCFPKSINTGRGMSGGSVFLIHGVVIEVLGTEGWISDANYSVKRTGTVAGSPGLWVCTEDAHMQQTAHKYCIKVQVLLSFHQKLFLMCFRASSAMARRPQCDFLLLLNFWTKPLEICWKMHMTLKACIIHRKLIHTWPRYCFITVFCSPEIQAKDHLCDSNVANIDHNTSLHKYPKWLQQGAGSVTTESQDGRSTAGTTWWQLL